MPHIDLNYPMKRRISEGFSFGYLFGIEAFIIMFYEVTEDGMCRVGCLNHHDSGIALSSCPSGHLLEHLIGSFSSAKIRLVEQRIGFKNANETNVIKMQSLGHHLCTDKDIHLMGSKLLDDALMPGFAAGGVQIHAGCARKWEKGMRLIFYHLRSKTAVLQRVGLATGRTLMWDRDAVTAVMAYQLLRIFMLRKRHIAVHAFRHIRALLTLYITAVSAAVLENNHLLISPDFIEDFIVQWVGEMAIHLLPVILPLEIDDLYLGQREPAVTLGEPYESELPFERIVIGFNSRCGRTE